MRAAGYGLVPIHERGRVVEHFTNAGHAVYRRRIGFLFELKTLDLGPCPPLAISDEPATCIADHLSSTCDPSLLMSGVFTPRPYDEPVAGRMVVVGALPSKFELEFVKKFDMWMAACEHNGIDPNIGVVKKPQTKREQRRAERARIRGQ